MSLDQNDIKNVLILLYCEGHHRILIQYYAGAHQRHVAEETCFVIYGPWRVCVFFQNCSCICTNTIILVCSRHLLGSVDYIMFVGFKWHIYLFHIIRTN